MQSRQNESGSVSTFDWLYTLASIYSVCVLPFLRIGMGSHALSFNGVFAGVLILTAAAFMKAPAMNWYLAAWLVAVLFQRISGWYLRRRRQVHSRYLGDPLLARLPLVSDNAARGVLEPLLTFGLALAIRTPAPNISGFLMGASVSLFIKNIIDVELDRARARNMRDSYIEQAYIAERFRQKD